MSRIVLGLRKAWRIERPSYLNSHRLNPVQRKGIAFENRAGQSLAKRFGKIELGQWFNFIDLNGPGICQPDIVVHGKIGGKEVRLVVECKLTVTEEAFLQITHLYVPVLKAADDLPTLGIVLAKNLTRWTPPDRIASDLPEALKMAASGDCPVLHWLGHTDL